MHYGREALRVARTSGSGYVARRLQTLRADLAGMGRDRHVAESTAEIAVVCAT
ncbi:hypothetical protein [Streptomyces sp. NPDC005017]|uniref:hypothetical protein n=1 Tax=Streptomyces sp. NPDC005017 TaxID=3364706 RepID=UPI0036835C98